jgi:2-amino-4-hydroxy-6-hydroxymethyldihydropteridine diphosphokinase
VSEQKEKIPTELILPHPRIQDRAFVLLPLLDVEPSWTHPILKKTVMQLYEELTDQEKKNMQIVQ